MNRSEFLKKFASLYQINSKFDDAFWGCFKFELLRELMLCNFANNDCDSLKTNFIINWTMSKIMFVQRERDNNWTAGSVVEIRVESKHTNWF